LSSIEINYLLLKKLRFFSKICINEWLSRVQTCPIDRTPMESDQLKPVPRILKNLLCRLVFIFEQIPEENQFFFL